MKVKIQLFGKAKEIASERHLQFEVVPEISILELKSVLIERCSFGQLTRDQAKALLSDCAFGNQERILSDQDILSSDQDLVVLPPVCGG